MNSHPERDLSAYADDSLAPADASALTAHLAACLRCGRRVEELRAVRRLLAATPAPRPSRSLLPRLSRVPAWLWPARSLASVGAGAFLFLFLASAVLQSGSSLGGGTTAAERAAARGQLAAPAASDSGRFDAAKASPAAGVAAQPAGRTPAAVIPDGAASGPRALPAGGPEAVVRRDFGPPAWIFAMLAAACGAFALGIHRRLRRS